MPGEGADMAQYQIAFQFQFKQNISNGSLQIAIADQNNFVTSSSHALQLSPFDGSVTPPLNNLSVSSTALLLNVASGEANKGVEVIAWTTGIDDVLKVNYMTDGTVAAYYSLLGGTGNTGQLQPGLNSIPLGNG
jgi:hypothetical protein